MLLLATLAYYSMRHTHHGPSTHSHHHHHHCCSCCRRCSCSALPPIYAPTCGCLCVCGRDQCVHNAVIHAEGSHSPRSRRLIPSSWPQSTRQASAAASIDPINQSIDRTPHSHTHGAAANAAAAAAAALHPPASRSVTHPLFRLACACLPSCSERACVP